MTSAGQSSWSNSTWSSLSSLLAVMNVDIVLLLQRPSRLLHWPLWRSLVLRLTASSAASAAAAASVKRLSRPDSEDGNRVEGKLVDIGKRRCAYLLTFRSLARCTRHVQRVLQKSAAPNLVISLSFNGLLCCINSWQCVVGPSMFGALRPAPRH